jgi:CheY-like chemotaxis protein
MRLVPDESSLGGPPPLRSILIVDDDDDLREVLKDALLFEGYHVETTTNGREAVTWLRAHAGERWLVLLDLMMPVMDGEGFLNCRADDPVLAAFPVVLLTAGGDCRVLEAAHHLAACLPKTIPLPQLLTALEVCGSRGQDAAPRSG